MLCRCIIYQGSENLRTADGLYTSEELFINKQINKDWKGVLVMHLVRCLIRQLRHPNF